MARIGFRGTPWAAKEWELQDSWPIGSWNLVRIGPGGCDFVQFPNQSLARLFLAAARRLERKAKRYRGRAK